MTNPIIGITTGYKDLAVRGFQHIVSRKYTKAIIDAGGIPLLIPSNLHADAVSVIISRFDGLLLSGGGDVNPIHYGQEAGEKLGGISDQRDALEFALLKTSMEADKPILGICRGCQLINVALGGSLYQDIADEHPQSIEHDQHKRPRDTLYHAVHVAPDSRLFSIVNAGEIRVNSLHHQGIKIPSDHLAMVGNCVEDGLCEAVESNDYPFLVGVQWHPEELTVHPPHKSIFTEFMRACKA
jgi:putative glutamine amidotransferase